MITDHCAFCASKAGDLETFYALPVELGGGHSDSNLINVCGLHGMILQQVRNGMDTTSQSDSEVSTEITKLKQELKQSHARIDKLLGQKRKSDETINQQTEALGTLRSAHSNLKSSLEKKESELSNAEVIIGQFEVQANHATQKHLEFEAKLDNASQRINELEAMLSAYSKKNDSSTNLGTNSEDQQENKEITESIENVSVEQSTAPTVVEFGLSKVPPWEDSEEKDMPVVSEEEAQSTVDAFGGDLTLAAEVLGINVNDLETFVGSNTDPMGAPVVYDSTKDDEPKSQPIIKKEAHDDQIKQADSKIGNVKDCQILYKAITLGVHFNKNKVVIEQIGDERLSKALRSNGWSQDLFRNKEQLEVVLHDLLLSELSEQGATVETVARYSGTPVEYIQKLLRHADISDAKTRRAKTSSYFNENRVASMLSKKW